MKNLDYNYICTVIGNLTGIPIRLYRDNRQIFYHSLVHLPQDPITAFREDILAIDAHVGDTISLRIFITTGSLATEKTRSSSGPLSRPQTPNRPCGNLPSSAMCRRMTPPTS